MKIQEILNRTCICSELKSHSKEEVIAELAQLVATAHPQINAETLGNILMERERLGSTGIGNGVAILHGKLPELESIITGFGRSIEGIDFDAQDGEPVHLFFVLIAPKNSASLHLKAMARLSRLLKDAHFRNRLYESSAAEVIYGVITAEDEKY